MPGDWIGAADDERTRRAPTAECIGHVNCGGGQHDPSCPRSRPVPTSPVCDGATRGRCGYCGAPAWVNPTEAVASLNDVPEYVYASSAARAPTAAMIDAACRSLYGYANAPALRSEAENRVRDAIERALRAALAAQEGEP